MAGRRGRRALVMCAAVLGVGCFSAAAVRTTAAPAVNPTTTAPSPTTLVPAAAPTVASVTTTLPTQPDTSSDLAESLGVVFSLALDGAVLPAPDSACFAAAIAATNPEVQGGAAEVAADPLAWWQIPPETRLHIMTAALDCGPAGAVGNMLAISTINSIQSAPCIGQAWTGVLTTEAIASSMSWGGGLDDLPPDVVMRLVAGVMACMPGEQGWTEWWIEDISLEIERRHDTTSEQATCVATNFVQRLGVERAVERRVLTIPVLALPDADLARIDVSGCGAAITLPPSTPGVVGDCLATAEQPTRVACDTAHEREVIALVDVSGVMPAWPGHRALNDHGETACMTIAEAAMAGRDLVFRLYWWGPSRGAWERGSRVIVCTVGPIDNGVWTAPFALVPPAPATSTTPPTTPPITAAPTTATTVATPPTTSVATQPTTSVATQPTTTAISTAIPPATQQPAGLGNDPRLNLLAQACFDGDMTACDELFDSSPAGSLYEQYGDSCAGRQPLGTGTYCADAFRVVGR